MIKYVTVTDLYSTYFKMMGDDEKLLEKKFNWLQTPHVYFYFLFKVYSNTLVDLDLHSFERKILDVSGDFEDTSS